MTVRKAFVLLSGGLDSTTCLYKAIHDFVPTDGSFKGTDNEPVTWVEAVSIDYGQRHIKEAEYAQQTCLKLVIPHITISIANLLKGVMLTDPSIQIPNVSYADLPHGVSPTYVPFRNGLMLSTITAHAQKWINQGPANREAAVYFGAHSEDAANYAYPDCTPEFTGSMANAIYMGSYHKIRLHTPLQWLYKKDIVRLGHELGVPFKNTWSCYKGEEKHCATCPTCRSRRQAFIDAGIEDPTDYAN